LPNLRYFLERLDLLSALDILLVATVIFALLVLVRGTRAIMLLRGVLLLVVAVVVLTSVLRLPALNWLIKNSIPALLVAIPVIFQPELRRALERLGRAGGLINRPWPEAATATVIDPVVRAAQALSKERHGAIIVLEQETGLQDFADTGVRINGEVTTELLLSLFYPNSPLHDGAVIVRGDQVYAAACLLPVAEQSLADYTLGTRHRAAIGVTEQTDAICIVVSEETGTISVARNGHLLRGLDEARLRSILQTFYRARPPANGWLVSWLRRNEK